MSQHDYLTICGDKKYVERICQAFLIELGWSRKRRKKWLRREGLKLTRQPDLLENCFDADGDDVLPGPCWCGEANPHYEEIHGTCGGTGYLNCLCGGDFCVCHNHGEVECFGCPDCEGDDDECGFDDGDDF